MDKVSMCRISRKIWVSAVVPDATKLSKLSSVHFWHGIQVNTYVTLAVATPQGLGSSLN
jgi:hypothetical protein